ncbi:MAG: hypothetical protein QOI31_1759 [Solirubrobacterales bacterium]|jgi:predicted nucleotidyltransferase component of viral defense system|nr:hypothetical protein [Solirubrobacterales bacterium]
MISYDEIRAKADEFDIHTSNVQRDYVFGWLVAATANDPTLGPLLTLKGGNALRKGYFPATRFSDDLDYSTPESIGGDELGVRFKKVCAIAQERSGVVFDLDRTLVEAEAQPLDKRQIQRLRLYFNDFTGTTQEMILKVRVDVTEFDQLFLPPQRRRVIHPYSDFSECNDEFACIALEEALADKLRALLQRQYSHDLFDLVYAIFLNRELDVDRFQVVRTFLRKSTFEGDALAARQMLLGLPFELMSAFWDELVMPAVTRFSFADAVRRFREGLTELFAPFAVSERRAFGYFPAESRAEILRAGANRKLLRMTYAGVPRVVEPYELVFKRPQGSSVQEYFYAFDTTGGRTSAPSMKSFKPEKIQALEATDQSFEPRFPIKLAAGGEPSFGSFASQRRGGQRAGIRRASGRASRPRPYKVRCSYCNRVFSRSKPSRRLNKHNDGYGNPCFGRVGYPE